LALSGTRSVRDHITLPNTLSDIDYRLLRDACALIGTQHINQSILIDGSVLGLDFDQVSGGSANSASALRHHHSAGVASGTVFNTGLD
jgi:hypothetical protein